MLHTISILISVFAVLFSVLVSVHIGKRIRRSQKLLDMVREQQVENRRDR